MLSSLPCGYWLQVEEGHQEYDDRFNRKLTQLAARYGCNYSHSVTCTHKFQFLLTCLHNQTSRLKASELSNEVL